MRVTFPHWKIKGAVSSFNSQSHDSYRTSLNSYRTVVPLLPYGPSKSYLLVSPRLLYGTFTATLRSPHGYRMVPPRLPYGPSTATIRSFNSYPQWLHGSYSNNNNKNHLWKVVRYLAKKRYGCFLTNVHKNPRSTIHTTKGWREKQQERQNL